MNKPVSATVKNLVLCMMGGVKSLMVVGIKEFLKRSVVLCVVMNQLLKELFCATIALCN